MATASKMSAPKQAKSTEVLRPSLPVPGPESIETRVLDIFRELLTELGSDRAARSVLLHSSLDRDLGLGSLERVELLLRCESRFNARLRDEVAQEADTPADWVRALREGDRAAGPTILCHYRIVPPAREAPPAPESARNWVEVLRRHADFEPNRVQAHLLEEEQDVTYGRLLEAASRVAAGLRARGLRRDDTVAIMLPTCADFLYAFFGVMLAGGIAVPIYPPARPDKIEEYVRRQVSILRNADVRFLISFARARSVSQIMRVSIPSLVGVTSVESLIEEAGRPRPTAAVEPSDTAFIQYTSGSTGEPKGVVLSHSNVLANVRGIGWAIKFRPADIVVSWLPLYHDMGLIGSWLFSVYFGAPISLLSPLAFLSRPERWLWAMHDSHGTLCPAPNFSYELCARKIPDRAIEGLDLSSWRVAINAGEAVLPETLERFARRFAPYGFRPQSFVPCYGLAESSVALAFPPINRHPLIDVIRRDAFESEGRAVPGGASGGRDVLRFVANGRPLPGHEIRILNQQGNPAGERRQGRLLFRGPSRTSGYFRNPQSSAEIISQDGWMDSGDLAYWADGELFVTGRSKDLIIKSGRNIIPQEVELAAADVPGVRRGCVAAFGTMDAETGTERLVVVAETRALETGELSRIEAEVMKRVDTVLGIPPDRIVLVRPQGIPKTSSGKIRRNATRHLYEHGDLHGAVRAPWMQIVRLWLEHPGSGLGLAARRASARLRSAYIGTVVFLAAGSAGMLARLVPSRSVAGRMVRSAARWILRLAGEEVEVRGDALAGIPAAVLLSNRAGRLDPLVAAASLPSNFLIGEPAVLGSLPPSLAFLLEPLVVSPVYGETAPRGGTLRQRIRRALEDGQTVLMFPDGPPGTAPRISRFRLEAFQAAAATSSAIIPIGLRGTEHVLEPARRSRCANFRIEDGTAELESAGFASSRAAENGTGTLSVGRALHAEESDPREITRMRERVREALAELCGDS
jgi:acyl-CoA synthetase (AMP-forming)/AMP-acid ligase II/1-acyl-sn-glycerol-3-phosphate acyltransferase/acyl carrier protein